MPFMCGADPWLSAILRLAINKLNHPMRPRSVSQMMRVAAIWFAVAICALASPPEENAKPASGESKPKITISKETTYITEPLRPDGYPDYVAALNQRMSLGVTPEYNAAVLLQKAFGPTEIPEELRADFFKQLRLDPLPDSGDYFVSRSEMIKRWRASHPAPLSDDGDDLDERFDRATQAPWKASDCPIVAEWLKINARPLKLIIAASARPRQFFPLILRPPDPLIACRLPHDTQIRDAAVALAARAMQSAGARKTSDAWEDLMACHRLARLTSSGPFLIDSLVGYAVEGIATAGDAALLHFTKPSRDELVRMRGELRKLSHFPELVPTFDISERFILLDAIQLVSREGLGSLTQLTDGSPKSSSSTALTLIGQGIDWDVPLRMGNERFDRLAGAARTEDRSERQKALEAFDADLRKLGAQVKDPGSFVRDFLTKGSPSELLSPRLGAVFVALFMPALDAALKAYDSTELRGQMDQTAYALAIYRADHGSYPRTLNDLVPKYLDRIPEDTFVRDKIAPIRYRREGDAYVMWTVFLNGVDDNGRGSDDDPPGDDWGLRPVPVKSGRAK